MHFRISEHTIYWLRETAMSCKKIPLQALQKTACLFEEVHDLLGKDLECLNLLYDSIWQMKEDWERISSLSEQLAKKYYDVADAYEEIVNNDPFSD